jgi:hypothetical protein
MDLRAVLGPDSAHDTVLRARSDGSLKIATPAAAKLGSESEDIAASLGSIGPGYCGGFRYCGN